MLQMKILGISGGRPGGNSELLLRIALKGASELGAQGEIVRLCEYDIRPCNGCMACLGGGSCPLRDDFDTLAAHFLDADGVLLSAPIYIWTPAGIVRQLGERFLPLLDRRLAALAGESAGDDPRLTRRRMGGFLAVGGTTDYKYVNMALPPLYQVSQAMGLEVVGQVKAMDSTMPGMIGKHPQIIAQAEALGRHVAEAIRSGDASRWYGDEGLCPLCHSDMITAEDGAPEAYCAACGVKGSLERAADGELHFLPRETENRLQSAWQLRRRAEIRAALKDGETELRHPQIPVVTK